MRSSKMMLTAALCSLAVLAVATESRANSILVTNAGYGIASLSPLQVRFDYNAVLDGAATLSNLQDGDGFTIYDFAGFTGAHAEPTGWTFSSGLATGFPPGTLPLGNSDDPNLVNLTWTYHGPTLNAVTPLGIFSAVTSETFQKLDSYAAQDHGFDLMTNSQQPQSNQGRILVAATETGGGTPTPLPVPAAVWGGLSLFGVLGSSRLRKSMRTNA